MPLSRIDHLAVQTWVTELGERLSPATVAECYRLTAGVLRSALRDRLIGVDPCDGVKLPRRRKKDADGITMTPTILTGQLLPAVPERYRALVAVAGGTGLRWGECIGLRWNAVDLDQGVARIVRVAVEVAGTVTIKPYPKTKAGRRGAVALSDLQNHLPQSFLRDRILPYNSTYKYPDRSGSIVSGVQRPVAVLPSVFSPVVENLRRPDRAMA